MIPIMVRLELEDLPDTHTATNTYLLELETAIDRMTQWLEAECNCPCCEQTRECSDECTFADDAPHDAERMAGARAALYGSNDQAKPDACGRSRLSAWLGGVTMNDTENLTLWLGAFRYYCGRMTYAVGDFCDLLRKEWPHLPERTRSLIRTELEETFARDDKLRPHDHCAPLGADCDRKEWEKVREIWAAHEYAPGSVHET